MSKCILVFDPINDILFTKCNQKFLNHVCKLAKQQGLLPPETNEEPDSISSNIIIQVFSPIITSQRLMSCQFGNSYTSIQCDDGTAIVFDEYMGYLFLHIGSLPIAHMRRTLGVCITLVKYLCGPNVPLLKYNVSKCNLLSNLLDTWAMLQDSDQATLVEAIEQLTVNSDVSSASMKALYQAVDKMNHQSNFHKSHALILVENKFLSLYSSKTAKDLKPVDIMIIGLLAESLLQVPEECFIQSNSESDSSDLLGNNPLYVRRSSESCINVPTPLSQGVVSHLMLLSGNQPHAIHISSISEGVNLILIIEIGVSTVATGLNEAFHALNALQKIQVQKDMEGVKHAFEFLDSGMKKIAEGVKKFKGVKKIDACQRNLFIKWDLIRKKYIEFIKTTNAECVIRIESATASMTELMRNLLHLTCLDDTTLLEKKNIIENICQNVKTKMSDFSDFLKVKALRNFTLGGRASLSINKYLEEFPGLVHFVYIDRSSHRVTAPCLDFTSEETSLLTKKKIWGMVEFARNHLQEGHLSMMWKDTTFNYAYFLWFEDQSGSPLKPKIYPTTAIKNFPLPGIIIEDFYNRVSEACFPKLPAHKIHCYELFCIHLGLATSSCVLEHSRRLAATIWEVTGIPTNPADLL